jgi:PAS domain S-box-containing protein
MTESLIDLAGLRVEVEEFLGTILEATEQPMWVVDHDDLIRFANPAAIVALGYEHPDELTGRNSHMTIHYRRPDGSPFPPDECPLLRPRTTGETITSEQDWFIRRDGSMFPVSYVSAPVQMDEGRGAVVVFNDIEDRLRAEDELREHSAVLAAQQASLRRVATLVTAGAPSADVLAAVAREVGQVVGLPMVAVWRFEGDRTATVLGAWSDRAHAFEVGSRWPLDGPTICKRILDTGRPARIDDFQALPGTIAEAARQSGIRSCAGTPIVVDGVLWGAMSTDSFDDVPLPEDVESRLAEFTELAAAAFSTTARQDKLSRLVDEQAALRRVATLVAQDVPSSELFSAVAREVGSLLGADLSGLIRYGADAVFTLATWAATGEHPPVPDRWSTEPGDPTTMIAETLRPARVDDWTTVPGPIAAFLRDGAGVRSSVGSPIVVKGRLWGALAVHSKQHAPLPPDTETRIAQFAELVATAIANVEARAEVERLAEEQAALRRVATLVAEGAAPTAVFDAVAGEMEALLDADQVALNRFEPGGVIAVLAHRGLDVERTPVGTRVSYEGESVTAMVQRTGRPARMENYAGARGALAELARETGLLVSVGAPIVVDGRLWGIITASWKREQSPPAKSEERMAHFAELLDTAIANADSRDQLTASRARLVTEGDEARRRVVRDLHDGAQQRLVHTIVTLKLAQRAFREGDGRAESLMGEALQQAERSNAELRELAHGILPSGLSHGGLRVGVDAFAARLDLPVQVDVPRERFPAEVEASAYFIVAEALTNVVKHSHAERAEVRLFVDDGHLRVEVRDDGVGGADPDGHGLVGLGDRANALGGRLNIESPANGGTLVAATLPV